MSYEQIIDQDIEVKIIQRQHRMLWKSYCKNKEGFKNNVNVHQAILFELVQNAIDCAIQIKQNEVKIDIYKSGRDLIFTHDVGFFTLDNIFSILWGDSDKFDQECKTIGQFGKGMYLTSLLSQKNKFIVSGQLQTQNYGNKILLDFQIMIDKSIDNEQEYLKYIEQEQQKLKNCPISIQTKQHTSIQYIDVDDMIYNQTKTYFDKHIPLTSYFLENELGIKIWINNSRFNIPCKEWVYLNKQIIIKQITDVQDVNSFIFFPISSQNNMIPKGWIMNDRQFVPDDKRDTLQQNNMINIQRVQLNINNALTSMMSWNGDWELISQSLIFSFELNVYQTFNEMIKKLFSSYVVLRVDEKLMKLNDLVWMDETTMIYFQKSHMFYIMADKKTNIRMFQINQILGLPLLIFNIQHLCSKLNEKQRLRLAMDYPNHMSQSSEHLEIQCWNALLQIDCFKKMLRCLPIQNGDVVECKHIIRSNNTLQRFIQSSIPNSTYPIIHDQIYTDYLFIDQTQNYNSQKTSQHHFIELTMSQTMILFEQNINKIEYKSYLSHPIKQKYCSPQLESQILLCGYPKELNIFRKKINEMFILELFKQSLKKCPILIQQQDLIEYINFQDIDQEFLKNQNLFLNICNDLIRQCGKPIQIKSQPIYGDDKLLQRFQKLIYNFYPISLDLKGDVQNLEVLCFLKQTQDQEQTNINMKAIALLCINYLDEQEIQQLNHVQLDELIDILKLFQQIHVDSKKQKKYCKKLKYLISEAQRYRGLNIVVDDETEIEMIGQFKFRECSFHPIPQHVIDYAKNWNGIKSMEVHCFNPMDQQNNQKLYDMMITMINSSQIYIDIAMMHISDPEITNSLMHAAERLGNKFRFVFDVYQYHTSGSLTHYITQIPQIQSRCQQFVTDIEAWNRIQQHTKIVIVDKKYVFFGSMNLSSPAIRPVDSKHSEIIVFDRYTDRYQEVFEQIWNQLCYQYTPKSLDEFQKVNAQLIDFIYY